MLIPTGTDAPIYHWPFATLGMIIICAFINVQMLFLPEAQSEKIYEEFLVHYGEWNPIQWVTSLFLFAGIAHLLANLFVLWGIGIIVEGKVGWWRFLLIYLGIGVLHNAVEQTVLLFADGFTAGPAPATYALLVIGLVWAPRNELNCLLIFGWRFIMLDLSVSAYVGFCFALELMMSAIAAMILAALEMTPFIIGMVLQLSAIGTGFVLAVGMLKLKWVDCENWDIFSVWQGKHNRTREQQAEDALNSEEGKAKLANHFENMHVQFRNYLAAGEAAAALSVHRRGRIQFGPKWQLSEEEQIHLIGQLRKVQKWDDAVLMMNDYLKTQTQRAPLVRLALAQVLVEQLSRPRQALKVLAKLDPQALPENQKAALLKLTDRAQREAEENPFEAVQDEV
jgi:membrane associated rhomboid family serine protease